MQPLVPRQRFTDLAQLKLSLQVGRFQSEFLGWGFFESRYWRNYLHVHSFFEICYAFEGRGLFSIAGQQHEVRQGQVFVARPGEVHEIISSEEDPLGIYFWSYTLTQCQNQPSQTSGSDPLLDAFLTSRRWVGQKTPGMQRTLELLTEEIAQQGPGYQQSIEGLLVKLLLDTARTLVDVPEQANQAEQTAKSLDEATVQVIIRYLHDNLNRPVLIRDLAAQIHLSERHTSRLFHKIRGMTIGEYVTNLRMERASQLLLSKHLPIKDVAQATGYTDVRYFTTLFHRSTGFTPAIFRQKGGTRFVEQDVPGHA